MSALAVLAEHAAGVLRARPGSTAAELARVLARTTGGAVDEDAVTRALCAAHGRFRSEGRPPRWALAGTPVERRPAAEGVNHGVGRGAAPASPGPPPLLDDRGFPAGSLWPWQEEALAAWARRGDCGVVEAVTGAGKTMVGIAAVLEQRRRRGQALVLVPTKELARQWLATLERSCDPATRVGALGDSSSASLTTHDVVVAVVNSVRAGDIRPIRPHGLIVADECHRYASAVNRGALDPRMTRRLGLSATYARDDDGHVDWLDPYFGGTCFRLGYAAAVAGGVVARPAVALVGVHLEGHERATYAELSEIMRRSAACLVRRHGVTAAPYGAFMREVNALADRSGDGEATVQARRYRHAVLERRRLLAGATGKTYRLAELLPAVRSAERTIVFTQTIAASEAAAGLLAAGGVPAMAVHSRLGAADRHAALGRFAHGDLRALCAPRVLDEGVDVPAADLAVIVAASRTRRQMIQRMGRVLRVKPDGRLARFAVLFAEGTVEDPHHGAHEGFVREITSVAAAVERFPAATAAAEVNEFLQVLGVGR